MSDTEQNINEVSFDGRPTIQGDGETKKVLNLSKAQLKALGLQYKPPQTEAQKTRNQRLSEMAKARHEKHRKEKEEYEKAQLQALTEKIVVDKKPKQKYVKQTIEIPLADSDGDDEMAKEYQEFLKFKKAQSKVKKIKPPPKEESSSDDEMIQKKAAKATKIIETVNKLDTAINKLSVGNPYLDLFNKPRK